MVYYISVTRKEANLYTVYFSNVKQSLKVDTTNSKYRYRQVLANVLNNLRNTSVLSVYEVQPTIKNRSTIVAWVYTPDSNMIEE